MCLGFENADQLEDPTSHNQKKKQQLGNKYTVCSRVGKSSPSKVTKSPSLAN